MIDVEELESLTGLVSWLKIKERKADVPRMV
jgi:hypothetical protein